MALSKKSIQNVQKTKNPQGPANIHPQPPAVNATRPPMQVIKVPGNAKRP